MAQIVYRRVCAMCSTYLLLYLWPIDDVSMTIDVTYVIVLNLR